ncbi:MAG: N4-gp56 family major capsid protein [Pontimonas sp.]
MALIKTDTSGLTVQRYSQLFRKMMLDHQIQKLEVWKDAEKFELPQNAGTSTLRMFKRAAADVTNVQTLTEGTAISTFNNTTVTNIDVALVQYADAARISDTRRLTDFLDQAKLEVERMGEEAAIHLDSQIRDAIVNQVTDLPVQIYGQGLASFNALRAASVSAGAIVAKDLTRAATQLKINRAPTFADGCYHAHLAPEQVYDLFNDDDWREKSVRDSSDRIEKGYIGTYFGVKVYENTNPFKEQTAADRNEDAARVAWTSGVPVYNAIILGKQAVGTVKLAGTSGPMDLQFMIVNKPDSANPLNQYTTIGWKAWYASKLLDSNWAVALRTKTTYA